MSNSFLEVFGLVTRELRQRFWAVTVLRALAGFLDVFALALIWFTTNGVISGKFSKIEFLGFTLFETQVADEVTAAILGVVVILIFTAKSLVGLVALSFLKRVAVDFEDSLTSRVLSASLGKGSQVRDTGVSDLPTVQHGIYSARAWVAGSVTSFSIFLSELSLVISMLLFMTLSDTMSAFIIIVTLGVTALLVQRKLNLAIQKQAKIQRESNLEWITDLSTAINVRTQLQLNLRAPEWSLGIREKRRNSSVAAGNIFLLNSIPRYALEFAVLLSIGIVIGLAFLMGDFSDNAAGAAVVLAGAFRISGALLPLQASISAMVNGKETSKAVLEALTRSPTREVPEPQSTSIRNAINRLLSNADQKFLVIRGPSGVGKTTSVIGAIEDLINKSNAVGEIGYAAQRPSVIPGGVARNLWLTYEDPLVDVPPNIARLAEKLGVGESLDRFIEKVAGTGTSVTLSGGETTKLEILRAHSSGSHLIVLDEPTNGLDGDSKKGLSDFMKSNSAKYVVITHDDSFAESLKPNETINLGSG